MKVMKVGLATGLNPLPALVLKAALLAEASFAGECIEIEESAVEARLDAPDARTALADKKIAAFLAADELDRAGCDALLIPDASLQEFLPEIQKEIQTPIVSIYAGVSEAAKAAGVRKIGVMGTALPEDFFRTLSSDVEWIFPTDAEREVFSVIQSRETGLRRCGLTEAHRQRLHEMADALRARGAELLVPNCTQIARFAPELCREMPILNVLRLAAEKVIRSTPPKLKKPFKVGLIGGLGPAATVDLYDKIVKATPAKIDQEHIKLVVEQNPQIPDRTAALLHGGEDPTIALYNCAQRLEKDGCDAIIVPCNTAHAFVPYLERHLGIPFINMQQTALDEIARKLGETARIGLLATSGTVQTGIYSGKAQSMGLPMFVPDHEHQERVMASIYGPKGAKAGYTDGICKEDLLSAAKYLVEKYDCNCLILGCTELPLILDESDDFEIAGKHVMVIDPTASLARRVVAEAF